MSNKQLFRELSCPNCGDIGSLQLTAVANITPKNNTEAEPASEHSPQQTVSCSRCSFITILVKYTCDKECCAPKGYKACPLCRTGASTDEQCFL